MDVEGVAPPRMRAPKLTRITKERFEDEYWPRICNTTCDILKDPQRRFSQVELYGDVYNVCCQNHSVLLYNNLLALVGVHMENLHQDFIRGSGEDFLRTFILRFTSLQKAINIIGVGFEYLERVYISKQSTTLKEVLLKMFSEKVIEAPSCPLKSSIIYLLQHLPPSADPEGLMNLVTGLYVINKDYANYNPSLFEMFIPCLRPCKGLDIDAIETLELVNRLKCQGYPRTGGCYYLKRKYDQMLST